MKKHKLFLIASLVTSTILPTISLVSCNNESKEKEAIPLDIYDTTSMAYPLLRSSLHKFTKGKYYYFKINYSLWSDWGVKKPYFQYFGENSSFVAQVNSLTATRVSYKDYPISEWVVMKNQIDYEITASLGILALTATGESKINNNSILLFEVKCEKSGEYFFVAN